MLQGDLMGLYSSWQEVGEMGFSSQETAIRWEGAVPGQGRLGMKRNLFSKEQSQGCCGGTQERGWGRSQYRDCP